MSEGCCFSSFFLQLCCPQPLGDKESLGRLLWDQLHIADDSLQRWACTEILLPMWDRKEEQENSRIRKSLVFCLSWSFFSVVQVAFITTEGASAPGVAAAFFPFFFLIQATEVKYETLHAY